MGVFMDLSKAFDIENNDVKKLEHYGLKKTTSISRYLERKQSIQYEREKTLENLQIRGPQDSVLEQW